MPDPSRRDGLDCLVPTSFEHDATGSGVLDGRSVVVKDLVALAGHRSSYGIPRWRDTHPPAATTAPSVTRLLAAGARLVGLTKLDSLAYSLVGNAGEGDPPRNPLAPDRFTGGSSSGSASAVAGGFADLGVGTDTAGSIRVPAASCGLCSIRPTHGLVDNAGVLPLAPSMDVVGVLARDPVLLRDAHAVLAGPGPVPTPPTRVLLAADALEWIDDDAADAVAGAAVQIAEGAGCALETAALGRFTSSDVAELFARVQGREIWAQHGAWLEGNLDCFIDEVRVRLERCRHASAARPEEQDADVDARRAYRDAFAQVVGPGDCVVVPVLHDRAPRRTASDEELVAFRTACVRLTAPSSLTGSPQITLAVRHERSGNSYGVGLIGAPGADRMLLETAIRACGPTGAIAA